MTDSQDEKGQHTQDNEYCVSIQNWESASFNSFPEDWTTSEVSQMDVDKTNETNTDQKKIRNSEDLLITAMSNYDINTTKTKIIGSIQKSDTQINTSNQPNIASQVTDTSKQEPTIASKIAGTSNQEPFIASQIADISKEEPFIATHITGTSKQEPTIASKNTGTSNQEPFIVQQITGNLKQEPTIESQTSDMPNSKSKPSSASKCMYASNEPTTDNSQCADELHENFAKMDKIQSSSRDSEQPNESDYDADDDTFNAQQFESSDIVFSTGSDSYYQQAN